MYMDIHEIPGATAEAVAKAHIADVETQRKYGVEYHKYWFNESCGKIFCLCSAPSPQAAETVHREAHGLLAAKELGAERIIAMSRHADRQALAREFGATDIVEERGDEGVARIKELTDGLGAHSVIEAVGTQESMMQAIHAARPGGYVGYVGVPHGVMLDGQELFFEHADAACLLASSSLNGRSSSCSS